MKSDQPKRLYLGRWGVLFLGCMLAACGGKDIDVQPYCASHSPWTPDFNTLVSGLVQLQGDPFADISETAFMHEVDQACAQLTDWEDDRVKLELARLTALIRDGHTAVFVFTGTPRFEVLPIRVDWFEDGLYVLAAGGSMGSVVGDRLVAIEGQTPEEMLEMIRPYVPDVNDQLLRWVGRYNLMSPQYLHALGLSEERNRLRLTFENAEGTAFEVLASGHSQRSPIEAVVYSSPAPYERNLNWTHAYQGTLPVHLKNPNAHYWMERRGRALYVQHNRARDAQNQSFGDFWCEVEEALEDPAIDRLIIDFRYNSGGDLTIARGAYEGLKDHRLNRPGGIFVLTGPKTFSAAIANANHILRSTAALHIGEEPGDILDSYNNTDSFILPGSGIEVQYGEEEQLYEDQYQERLLPDMPVRMSFADFVGGRDPVLSAALSY